MVERTIDTEAQVQVQINGEPRSIPVGMSVEQLLLHLDLHPKLIVVEHNGEILRRDSYAEASVAAGDTLELVHFVGGG